MLKSLIVILMGILSTVSCSEQLTLVPYLGYLADPFPVYHQSQNTRTGEHAYSYFSGHSGKTEVKGQDGITRGFYNYIDANGILQTVIYVADEGGFRVAATNLPTDNDLPNETAENILARNKLFEEQVKAKSSLSLSSSDEGKESSVRREKRSTQEEGNNKQDESNLGKPYGALASILLPKATIATSTSHQSHVQVHNNVKIENIKPVFNKDQVKTISTPVVSVIANPIELKTIGVIKSPSPVSVVVPKDYYYRQNLEVINTGLGLEGQQPNKDAIKIKTIQQPVITELVSNSPIAILDHQPSSILQTIPVNPTTLKTYFNQNILIPDILEYHPTFLQSIPLAKSSQYRWQIHSNQRIETPKEETN